MVEGMEDEVWDKLFHIAGTTVNKQTAREMGDLVLVAYHLCERAENTLEYIKGLLENETNTVRICEYIVDALFEEE